MAKKKTAKKGQWVILEWRDACGHAEGWTDPEDSDAKAEAVGLLSVVSAGLVVEATREFVTIAQSQTEGGDVDHILNVPRGWITKVEVVRG